MLAACQCAFIDTGRAGASAGLPALSAQGWAYFTTVCGACLAAPRPLRAAEEAAGLVPGLKAWV